MNEELAFTIKTISFDENYRPSDNTRITTNFANLARGSNRQQNLRDTLGMINNRFNALADWDNPKGDRYSVELEIISIGVGIGGKDLSFPMMEVLKTNIVDRNNGQRIEGIVGNNFSSYLRDYDFSVLLVNHNQTKNEFRVPDDFGDLHGKIFKCFVNSPIYKERFSKPPVICLSVSSSKTYQQIQNQHPILGIEYQQSEFSSTDQYFKKMGMKVRYFMTPNSVAPLAFYFRGDLLADYTNLELIGTISTMETFQKIYRPEIYNSNAVAGKWYQPSLTNRDHSLTQIVYDREERSRLAIEQGKLTEESFIKPYKVILDQWAVNYTL